MGVMFGEIGNEMHLGSVKESKDVDGHPCQVKVVMDGAAFACIAKDSLAVAKGSSLSCDLFASFVVEFRCHKTCHWWRVDDKPENGKVVKGKTRMAS